MTLWTLGMGVSTSLVASAIVYWITVRNLVPSLVIGGTGVIVFLVTLLFTKKPTHSTPPTYVTQENKLEANPQITLAPQQNVYIGASNQEQLSAEHERIKRENLFIEHMKLKHPTIPYLLDELAEDLDLGLPKTRDIMKSLASRGVVNPQSLDQAIGGTGYFLDELYRPNPQPSQRPKPNTVTTYRYEADSIPSDRPKIIPVRFGRTADNRYGLFLRNDGISAFDIAVQEPIQLGTSKLHFWNRTYSGLTKDDGELFIEAHIALSSGSGLGASALRDQMVKASLESLPIAITYRDFDNNRWITHCEILKEFWEQGLRISSRKQERLQR